VRTCTCLIYCNGKTRTRKYAVMQGRMLGRAFDLSTAEIVATYTTVGETPDYVALTARHATPKAPAVYWQR
jgi:hypothetical protein